MITDTMIVALGSVAGALYSGKKFCEKRLNERDKWQNFMSTVVGGAVAGAALVKGANFFVLQPGLVLVKCISNGQCSIGDCTQISLLGVSGAAFWGIRTFMLTIKNRPDGMASSR